MIWESVKLKNLIPDKVWTAVLYDEDQQGYPYIKRFTFEQSAKKQNYLGENRNNRLILLTDEAYPRLQVNFGGKDSFREALVIEAADFIGTKSYKAKGKRLTTFDVESIQELEPTHHEEKPDNQAQDAEEQDEMVQPTEENGQMNLFEA